MRRQEDQMNETDRSLPDVRRFVAEECLAGKEYFCDSWELLSAFERWCEDHDIKLPGGTAFFGNMEVIGFRTRTVFAVDAYAIRDRWSKFLEGLNGTFYLGIDLKREKY